MSSLNVIQASRNMIPYRRWRIHDRSRAPFPPILICIALTIFSATGCASWQVIPLSQTELNELAQSDTLVIRAHYRNGDKIAMKMIVVKYPYLIGTEKRGDKFIQIDLREIDRVDIRKGDPGKTAMAVVLGTVLTGIIGILGAFAN